MILGEIDAETHPIIPICLSNFVVMGMDMGMIGPGFKK